MGRKSKISNVKGLIKHPNSRTFWFRRVVPADLRACDKLGKREIKFTLGTSDLRKAEVLAAQHWIKWTHHFDDLRHDRIPDGLIPTDDDLARLAVEWRDLWFKADEIEDEAGTVESEVLNDDGKVIVKYRPYTVEEKRERRRVRLIEMEKAIYQNDQQRLSNTARDILKYSREKFSTSVSIVDRFTPVIAEAEYDAYQIQMNRERGERSMEILRRDPMEYVSNNMTISKLLENYLISKNSRTQTEAEWRTVFNRLIQVVGDKPARELTKHDISKFLERVSRLPSRARKAVRQLPVDEMIALADQESMDRVSIETVRKHVTAIRSVFSWALDRDYVSKNPASKLAPKREPSGSKRLPFSQDEITLIFDPDTYNEYPRHAADYWIPILCLFTGARIEEIAQLHTLDIRYEENIPVIEISPNKNIGNSDETKRVKNQTSARTIPVHTSLLEFGFLKFVEERKLQKGKRLFPELKRNSNERLSRTVSQRFARHLRNVGISDPRKVFHSFRHTFKDACRNAGILEEVHDRLTGHTSSSIGRYYGQGPNMQVLNQAINKIQFVGVSTFKTDCFPIL